MKTPSWVWAILVVVGLVQLAVPARMIAGRELTLRTGQAYRFRTRPVDPYDAFRGRYVALGFEQNQAPWEGGPESSYGGKGYALVETDQDGFAVISRITRRPPSTGVHLRVTLGGFVSGSPNGPVYFGLPFDRYYLEETKAPEAERIYREHNRRGQTNLTTYAVVRIRNGESALEDLIVGGEPIREWLTAPGAKGGH